MGQPEPLQRPIDIRWLVVLRIAFGAMMLWEVGRYFALGWIDAAYVEPTFFFTYYGFEWVHPLPGIGMHLVFAAMGVFACGIALGAWYRISSAAFFVLFTYLFLLDQARYLNHFYLICLVALLLVFLPAHRAWSIDAWRRPAIASGTVGAWTIWLLRFQVGIVYFYAGVAKLNADWLQARPLVFWLAERRDLALIGPLLEQEWVAWVFSYSGLLLDLLAAPLLLWRRTRLGMFLFLVSFHLMNKVLFSIGVFPAMMLALTTVFFEPAWPARWVRPLRTATPPGDLATRRPRLLATLLSVWVLTQVLIPLRHFVYPGNVSWNELGHRFAWHMKLRDKDAQALFFIYDPDAESLRTVDPRDELTPRQARKMAAQPDMIIQYAHHLARRARERGASNVEVRARSRCSLNGRPPSDLIDPSIDLANRERSLGVPDWIFPLLDP